MNRILPLLLLILTVLPACHDEPPRDWTVARLGEREIRFSDLERSFWLNPHYAIRTPIRKARESQLQHLLEENYRLLAAKELKLDQEPLIQKRIDYIRRKEILKAYLQENFIRQAQIDATELLKGYVRFNQKVRVQHLFTPSQEEALRLKSQLDQGADWNLLAQKVFAQSPLAETNGEIGEITFGSLDPPLEDAVFSMKPGEISEPVQSRYGYHILRVVEARQDPLKQHMSNAFKNMMVRDIIRNRKADNLIRQAVEKLAGGVQLQVDNRIVEKVLSEISFVMGAKYARPGMFKSPIRARELNLVKEKTAPLQGQYLARFGNRAITVEDFLNRIGEMPPMQRPYLRTRTQLVQFLINMIRKDLLLEEALLTKTYDRDHVKEEVQRYSEEVLIRETTKRLKFPEYRAQFGARWQRLPEILDSLKAAVPYRIDQTALVQDVANPDSLLTDPPIPLMIKSSYVW